MLLQVFAIEFVTHAIDFVLFTVEFIIFAIEFVLFAIEFVSFAIEFVTLATEFDMIAIELGTFALEFVRNNIRKTKCQQQGKIAYEILNHEIYRFISDLLKFTSRFINNSYV